MGSTNTTTNYNLSQFVGTDKPAWLQDYNGDMLKIDTGINAAKVAADGAQNSADSAQNTANSASSAIENTINPAISSLNTVVGNQGGAINTINSLIGNGTPTTTDQTIIGAINEINDKVNEIVVHQRYSKAYVSPANFSTIIADLYTSGNLSALTKEEAGRLYLKFGISGVSQIFRCVQFADDMSDFRFERVYSQAIDLIRVNSNSSNNEYKQFLFSAIDGSGTDRLSVSVTGTFSVWY